MEREELRIIWSDIKRAEAGLSHALCDETLPEPDDHNEGTRGFLRRAREGASPEDQSAIDDLLAQRTLSSDGTAWRWATDELDQCVWG